MSDHTILFRNNASILHISTKTFCDNVFMIFDKKTIFYPK